MGLECLRGIVISDFRSGDQTPSSLKSPYNLLRADFSFGVEDETGEGKIFTSVYGKDLKVKDVKFPFGEEKGDSCIPRQWFTFHNTSPCPVNHTHRDRLTEVICSHTAKKISMEYLRYIIFYRVVAGCTKHCWD